jgi:predicted cupin superfamily sugar epimerase
MSRNDDELMRLVQSLDLKPHPEGGYYKETYRSPGAIPREALPEHFPGERSHATAIYFLVPAQGRSLLHRIKSDEVWHFYKGRPLTIVELTEAGGVETTRLGTAFERGEVPQHVVKAGRWFGAFNDDPEGYAFVGCTVSPGFDFEDFELARRDELLARWPAARPLIEKLTE